MDALGIELQRLRAAARRLLLLDYDGTLVPIAPVPELATPDPGLLALLKQLGAMPGTEIHVVSGRGRDWLGRHLQGLPIRMHAEHGFWSQIRAGLWVANGGLDPQWRGPVRSVLAGYARVTPGSLIEEKQTALAFHYRCVAQPIVDQLVSALREELRPLVEMNPIELLEGRCVLEIRPRGINKGRVVEHLLRNRVATEETVILAAGDDVTDEEMFRALPDEALTIQVGDLRSCARHRVAEPGDLRRRLAALLD